MGKTNELYIQLQDELINTIHSVDNGEMTPLDALLYMRDHKRQLELTLDITKEFEDNYIDKIAFEAAKHGNTYKGYEIKAVNGRRIFDCSNVPEYTELNNELKKVADKYKSAFEGVQRGIVQTTNVDGITYWVDDNGELRPFPELKYGKSYLKITGSADQF